MRKTLLAGIQALISFLIKMMHEGGIKEKLNQLSQSKFLIIDETGHIPIARLGANFFGLIARQYEKGSMILMSNQT